MDKLFILPADFPSYKDLSANMDAGRIDALTRMSQIMDLRPFIGNELYLLLQDDFDDTNQTFATQIYTDLFDGVDQDGVRYYGLKPMLVQYTYARILDDINVSVTRAGVRAFDDELSDAVVQSLINNKAISSRSEALVYQNDSRTYLINNNATYPTWSDPEAQNTGFKWFKTAPKS